MSNLSDKPWLVPGHMYQYDIGWLVQKILSFETELGTAIDLKTIHYADPIQWDITTQYAPNTVVVDPKTGTAYMSKVPVPLGVLLTNTDYWVVIFNYQRVYDKIMSGVAFNDKDNLNATKDLLVNDLVWYGGDLYRCTRAIPEGTTYIPGTNLTTTTIADCLATYYGRDRVAQVLNDTTNVSGDYTLNAGDIAETASHVTIHSTQDMLLDADGNLTEQVAGGKTSEVGGKLTERVTGSRELNVDGDDSVHVDGVTSINRGGAVTEVYNSSKNKRVAGSVTNIYNDSVNDNYQGLHKTQSKREEIIADEEIKMRSRSLTLDSIGEPINTGFTIEDTQFFGKIPIRDAQGNIRKILLENNGTKNLETTGYSFNNVVIIGDSFAGNWYSGYQSYAYLLKDLLKINTLHVYSIGGAGFLGKGTLAPYTNVTFQEYLDAAYSSEMQSFANDVSLVIIQGGGNDYKQEYGAETTAVKNLITDIKTKFPNADVYGVSGFWLHNMFSDTKNGIIRGFNESGTPLFPNCFYTFINHTDYFTDDKLHPNEIGMRIMAAAIANNLMFGSDYNCNQGGFISAPGGGFIWQITNDGWLRGYVVTTATSDICDIPKTLQPAEADVFGTGYSPVGTGALASLWYNNQKLKIYVPGQTSSGAFQGSINWLLNANDDNSTG